VRDAGVDRCAIVSFSHDRYKPEEVMQRLADQGIAIGNSAPGSTRLDFEARHLPDLCRASVHYLNTEDEIAMLASAVAGL